jgi:solute carrier family 35, member E1
MRAAVSYILLLICFIQIRYTDSKKFSIHLIAQSNLKGALEEETLLLELPSDSNSNLDPRNPNFIMEKYALLPSNSDPVPSSQSITKTLKLAFHFFLWYFFTVVYNVSNKNVLNDLPLPATISLLQIILGIPVFLPIWILKRPSFESVRAILPTFFKIGFLHAMGNLATVMSLSRGSVSFTHIIKAAEPIFSAALSASIYGDYAPTRVYLTLIPIVFGVAMASAQELSFTWVGFLAGMASNLFYQLRMVLSKKEITTDEKSLTPSNFFRVLTIVSALELLPISIALEGYKVRSVWEAARASGVNMDSLLSNLLISGFSYYCYNEVAFWILGSISPMTHAVGNTVKRVIIILASLLILKAPISNYGMLGSTIAVLGTFAYSAASNQAKSAKTVK